MGYTGIAIVICVLVGFWKIGELDEDLTTTQGLIVGALVVLVQSFFPRGYLFLALYVFLGVAVLTICKVREQHLARRRLLQAREARDEDQGQEEVQTPPRGSES